MVDKQIQKLLKNLSNALQYLTVEELNSYICSVAKDDEKAEAQTKILKFVCEKYGITLNTLIKTKSNQNQIKRLFVQEEYHFVYCTMYLVFLADI